MGLAALIIPLIVQQGIPAALQIINLWKSQEPAVVGLQEWIDLLTAIARTPAQAIADAEKRAGVV